MTTLTTPHVWLDEKGVAWVDNTRTKVREIALDVIVHGWSPKEIHENHPHLSLAQIHGALTYYYDNKGTVDKEIEAARKFADEMRAANEDSPVMKELLARLQARSTQ